MKRLFLFALILLTGLNYSDELSARDAPASWESFIDNTELLIEATVIEANFVDDPFFNIGRVVSLKLEILEPVYIEGNSLESNRLQVVTPWAYNRAPVGSEGLFFLRLKDGYYAFTDMDVGYWERKKGYVYKGNSQSCAIDEFKKEDIYYFPSIYLHGIPKDYWELGYLASRSCVHTDETTLVSMFKKQPIFLVDRVRLQLKNLFKK